MRAATLRRFTNTPVSLPKLRNRFEAADREAGKVGNKKKQKTRKLIIFSQKFRVEQFPKGFPQVMHCVTNSFNIVLAGNV